MPKQYTVATRRDREYLLELIRTAKGEKQLMGRGKRAYEERIGDVFDVMHEGAKIGEIRRLAREIASAKGTWLSPYWSGRATFPGGHLVLAADTREVAASAILDSYLVAQEGK